MSFSLLTRFGVSARQLVLSLLVLSALLLAPCALLPAFAAVRYVDDNNTHSTPPYTNWATAAATIQQAVDAAQAGDEIVVTNGTYATGGRAVDGTMTNRVAVDKPLTLRSVNGPQFTMIQGAKAPGGGNGDGAIRCVYLANGASLSGFTLTNGATRDVGSRPPYRESSGGGVWCESTNAMISNCTLAGNSAWNAGGGAYGGTLNDCMLSGNSAWNVGGGAYGGTLNNCTLTGNSAQDGGGAYGGTLNDCTLSGNWARAGGGGASEGTLNHCTLTANLAAHGGGASGGTLNHCTLTGNTADGTGGGGALNGTLNNCTLTGNSAQRGGGATGGTLNNCTLTGNTAYGLGGGAGWCTLNNCTLTGNSAYEYGGGAYWGRLNNCIVYFNTAPIGANFYFYFRSDEPYVVPLNYCCTTPLPADTEGLEGLGNFTNAPLFVNYAGGNLRLQSNSPCINAGLNAYDDDYYDPGPTDLDGNPRIVGGTVDIGAYEFQGSCSVIPFAWLQQYRLPTDGSADTADPDGDGLNNWQEWRCKTDPTTALSVLRLLSVSSDGAHVTVRWQSVAGVTYFLERSTDLSPTAPFTRLAARLVGQTGTTTYTDTNAVPPARLFYRVGVGD